MKQKRTKVFSILLAVLMIVGVWPQTALPVWASSAEATLQLGMAGIQNGDKVWFGTEEESPVLWRVLSALNDTTHNGVDLSDTSGAEEVLLIREYLCKIPYKKYVEGEPYTNSWADSDAKVWCGSYYIDWPNAAEKAAINSTSVSETEIYTVKAPYEYRYGPAPLVNEHFFLLSAKEASAYFTSASDRVGCYSNQGSELWWLRSPHVRDGSDYYVKSNEYVAQVTQTDGFISNTSISGEYGGRPAFNLNPDNVLFVSNTATGKTLTAANAIETISSTDTSEWKLTLIDRAGHSGFNVAETALKARQCDSVTLSYSGAATGANEYVSVLLCDEAGTLAEGYGSSRALTSESDASGEVTFSLPADISEGTYKLKVFNEKKNGNSGNDYASNFDEVTLNVYSSSLERYVTPAATFTASGADRGTLTNVTSGMKYSLDGGLSWSDITGDSVTISSGVTAAKGIKIYMPGDYVNDFDSTVQRISVTQQSKPAGLGKTDCTTNSNDDGTITGLDSAATYEYRTATGSYSAVTAGAVAITGLANGTYYVRVKESGAVLASPDSDALVIAAHKSSGGHSGKNRNTGTENSASTPETKPAVQAETPATQGDKPASGTASESVAAGATVKDGKATAEFKGEDAVKAVENVLSDSSAAEKEITVNITGTESSDVVEATLSGDITKKLANGDVNTTINTALGNVTIPGDTLENIALQAGGNDVTVSVEKRTLGDAVTAAGGTENLAKESGISSNAFAGAIVVEVNMSAGGKAITNFGGSGIALFFPINGTFTDGIAYKGVSVSADGTVESFIAECVKIADSLFARVKSGHLTTFVVTNEEVKNPFADVKESDYFFRPVLWAADKEVTGGVAADTFAPNAGCTRAQMVTFLWRAAGKPWASANRHFSDVAEGAYYKDAVEWAIAAGITKGVSETVFDPNGAVTREQLASFIYRYAQDQGMGFTDGYAFKLDYSDASAISSWADEAMHWCVMQEIVGGTGNGKLTPQGTATRGQIVTMLYRYFNL